MHDACIAGRQAHGDIRAYTLKWQEDKQQNSKTCKDTGDPYPSYLKRSRCGPFLSPSQYARKKIVVDFFSGIME
jgi:hypothetical protein